MKTKSQTEFYIDSGAHTKLTRIVDENGNTTSLSYNGSGQLIKVTDPVGREADLTWTSGHLTSIEEPTTTPNREATYTYTGNNLTTAKRLLEAGVWAQTDYSYNAADQMIGIVTPDGETVEINYAGSGGPFYNLRSSSLSMAVTILWDTGGLTANAYGYSDATINSNIYTGEQYSTNGETFVRTLNFSGDSRTRDANNNITQ